MTRVELASDSKTHHPLQHAWQEVAATITVLYLKIAEALLIVWFYIQYLADPAGPNLFDRWEIFHFKDYGDVHNCGKPSDFRQFAKQKLNPFTDGHCYGASVHACKLWFDGSTPGEIAQEFKNGVPIKGVEIHAEYWANVDTIDYRVNEKNVLDQHGLKLVSENWSIQPTMTSGAYIFVFSSGEDANHAISIFKDDSITYFLDTNIALGYCPNEQAPEVIGRLEKKYGSFSWGYRVELK